MEFVHISAPAFFKNFPQKYLVGINITFYMVYCLQCNTLLSDMLEDPALLKQYSR